MNGFWSGLVSIFSNEWTVTIIGGLLLTGLIKIGEKIYSISKVDKDVRKANKEVVDFLEKVITSKTELTLEFLDSIMSSISRKNEVTLKRMNSKVEVIEDVMLKLYQIDYLSLTEKNEMIEKLIKMKKEINKPFVHEFSVLNKNFEVDSKKKREKKNRELIQNILPLYIAVVGLLMSAMTMLTYFEKGGYSSGSEYSDGIVLVMFVLITIVALMLSMYTYLNKVKRRRIEQENVLEEFTKKIRSKNVK
ncbi:hypothetical protein [uncultured Enterococcus sp.]|jgi:uncharacterized membrane protein|uniref:hypothetical protein n=1 Tax=uncultured Enterococcus sp. TaxID=167972 RepID=UPI00258CB832|nr:hypothetical protein [uncultured Enterococcus sp.]